MTTRFAPGSPAYTRGTKRSFRKEAEELLARRLESGYSHPTWGAGLFQRHIVFGIFEPISLCGRHVGDVSTEPMPTLIGVPCHRCISMWNRAMDVHNERIEATNEAAISSFADKLDDLIGDGDLDGFRSAWRELNDQRPLQRAVTDRLIERGIDVDAALESVGITSWTP